MISVSQEPRDFWGSRQGGDRTGQVTALTFKASPQILRFIDHNPAIEVGCNMPINLQCSPTILRWDARACVEQ